MKLALTSGAVMAMTGAAVDSLGDVEVPGILYVDDPGRARALMETRVKGFGNWTRRGFRRACKSFSRLNAQLAMTSRRPSPLVHLERPGGTLCACQRGHELGPRLRAARS